MPALEAPAQARAHQRNTVAKTNRAGTPAQAPRLVNPTQEEIARLAYAYWEERGRAGGSADDDWLRAEWELQRGVESEQA